MLYIPLFCKHVCSYYPSNSHLISGVIHFCLVIAYITEIHYSLYVKFNKQMYAKSSFITCFDDISLNACLC